MQSFKEFKENCIYQVFSDTIQKCIHIVKYYTPQMSIAQGFTVPHYPLFKRLFNPFYETFLFTFKSIEDQRFLSKIFLQRNAQRKLGEDFTTLCLQAIHSTFVFYLHSSPLVNGWSHFTIHFSSRMQ